MHLLDGVDQIGQALQGKVLALHRHNHAVRTAQTIEREHGERGRAIDQDEIVLSADRRH